MYAWSADTGRSPLHTIRMMWRKRCFFKCFEAADRVVCRESLQNASILSGRSYLPREARSRSMSKPVVWTTASMRRTSRKNIHAIRSVCVYFHMSKVRSTTARKSMWQRRRRKFRCKMLILKNRRKKNICVLFMQTVANIIIPAKNLAKWI